MGSGSGRPLARIPIPPGPAGLAALRTPLAAALDGTGPAIVPVPVVGVTVSSQYVQRLLDATRPDDASAPLQDEDIAVVMPTSGSTASPRGVEHTAASLQALTAEVNGDGAPQWIAALPLTSMGGFNVALRAWGCGVDPIALPSIGGATPFTPEAFAAAVAQAARSSDDIRVSLVAAQVRRLLGSQAGPQALAQCRQVLVGGGPLPTSTLDAAQQAGIAITRTYGATETAGGCVYEGVALPGVRIRIDGTPPAEVVVSGPMLARGYRLQPALTAAHFTAEGYRTGDLGHLQDGLLRIDGRMDEVVVIAGVNVSVAAVEAAIAELPQFAACAVVNIDGDTGEPELAAVVVPQDPLRANTDLEAAGWVRDAVRTLLGRPAVPRHVALADALPTLPNGKPDRQAIAEAARRKDGFTWQP